MSEWRHQGKQVLQDGRHFADAAGELEAMMIVNAMRALDARGSGAIVGKLVHHSDPAPKRPTDQPTIGDVINRPSASLCRPMREQDEYVCYVCSVRWDVREPAPRCGRAT